MSIINAEGLRQIRVFLSQCHRLGGDHFTPDMLRAWAAEAEFQLAEGNSPTIEIASWDSLSGRAEVFTLEPGGVGS